MRNSLKEIVFQRGSYIESALSTENPSELYKIDEQLEEFPLVDKCLDLYDLYMRQEDIEANALLLCRLMSNIYRNEREFAFYNYGLIHYSYIQRNYSFVEVHTPGMDSELILQHAGCVDIEPLFVPVNGFPKFMCLGIETSNHMQDSQGNIKLASNYPEELYADVFMQKKTNVYSLNCNSDLEYFLAETEKQIPVRDVDGPTEKMYFKWLVDELEFPLAKYCAYKAMYLELVNLERKILISSIEQHYDICPKNLQKRQLTDLRRMAEKLFKSRQLIPETLSAIADEK